MGQQQLLLLVLGIVIVGLAVVAGINAFQENQRKSNADALVNEGMRIATDAQAWRLKPEQFAGGGGDWTYNNAAASLETMGIADTGAGDDYASPWGTITFDGTASPATFTLVDLNNTTVGVISLAANGDITYAQGAPAQQP